MANGNKQRKKENKKRKQLLKPLLGGAYSGVLGSPYASPPPPLGNGKTNNNIKATRHLAKTSPPFFGVVSSVVENRTK